MDSYKKVRTNTFEFSIATDKTVNTFAIQLPAEPCYLTTKEAERLVEEMEKMRFVMKEFARGSELLMDAVETALGLAWNWQDKDGVVYRTYRPEWKSVKMEHFGVERTRFEGLEEKGSLSKKTAELLGYGECKHRKTRLLECAGACECDNDRVATPSKHGKCLQCHQCKGGRQCEERVCVDCGVSV